MSDISEVNFKFCEKFLTRNVYPKIKDLTSAEVKALFLEYCIQTNGIGLCFSQLHAVATTHVELALNGQSEIDYSVAQKASDLIGEAMII